MGYNWKKLSKNQLIKELKSYMDAAGRWKTYFYGTLTELRRVDKENQLFKNIEDRVLTVIDKQIRGEDDSKS